MSTDHSAGQSPAHVAFYNDPKIRSIIYQVALCAAVGFLLFGAATNAIENLRRAHIASGFGFWDTTAGFEISQTLISYSADVSTYGRAFWVGLLNTLLVAGAGIVFATIIGFVVGISRLSKNWLLAKVATGYVESIRNIPLLLQLLFWYNAVLKSLPAMRESFTIPGGIYLNNRGNGGPQAVELFDHLRQERGFAFDQVVGQQDGKGFITDDVTGAPHRMSKP
jgi:general L-amino acid transport system permease protein